MSAHEDDYRKAELIELHDRGVVIHPRNADAHAGWSEFASESNRYVIDGTGAAELAEHLGVDIRDRSAKTKSGRDVRYALSNHDITILKKPVKEIGTGRTDLPGELSHEIKELWARVLDSQLLSIRFITIFNEEEGSSGEVTQEVTYCGSFSVWWSQEAKGSATVPENSPKGAKA